MTLHEVEIALTEGTAFLGITDGLQVDEQGDERGYGGLCQGIAGGDVHLVDGIGQTVDDGLQELFVGQYDGGALAVVDTPAVEPGADVSGLDVLCRCGDEGDLLGTVETVVEVGIGIVERIGEVVEVLGDEVAGLVLAEVGSVEVPQEAFMSVLRLDED